MRMERKDGRHASPKTKTCYFCYILCVSPVFAIYAICVMRYPPNGRLISREDAHPLYPRYPRVLNYMLLFTAHSPTNLCEKGWGYHCCVLVWLLALFSAKLNRFFRKYRCVSVGDGVECLSEVVEDGV